MASMGTRLIFDIFARAHGSRDVDRLSHAINRLYRNVRNLDKTTVAFNRLGGSLRALTVGGLAGGFAAALPTIISVGRALASASTSALTLAPAIFAAAAGFGALRASLGRTFKLLDLLSKRRTKANLKEIKEVLGHMSPAARRFGYQLIKLGPVLRGFQERMENAFFKPFNETAFIKTVKRLFPVIEKGLKGISATAAVATNHLVAFFGTSTTRNKLAELLASTNRSFASLARVPTQLTKAFIDLSLAAAPGLERLMKITAELVDRLAAAIGRGLDSGNLERAVQRGIDSLLQLGRIARNVAEFIIAVFQAVGEQKFVDQLERATKAMADFAKSAEGAEKIKRFVDLLVEIGKRVAVVAVFTGSIQILGTIVATAVAPIGRLLIGLGLLYFAFNQAWKTSERFRETVRAVVRRGKELWGFIKLKMAPVIEDFAKTVSDTLEYALRELGKAVEDNRPQLEKLWFFFKMFVGFLIQYVVPVFLKILPVAIFQTGLAIYGLIQLMSGIVKGIGWVLRGLAAFYTALGKINPLARPIGRTLTDLAESFDNAGKSSKDSFGTTIEESKKAKEQLKKYTETAEKIPISKSTKISSPGAVKSNLELVAVNLQIRELHDKTFWIRERGSLAAATAVRNVLKQEDSLYDKLITIKANAQPAMNSIGVTKRALEHLDDKIITLELNILENRDLKRFRNLVGRGGAGGMADASGPAGWPLPAGFKHISSGFGPRAGGFHRGYDFPAPTGTPVYATTRGRITSAGWAGAAGNMVQIQNGNVTVKYMHLSRVLTRAGMNVTPGNLVGLVGSTGQSTGPHLHWQMERNGVAYPFLRRSGGGNVPAGRPVMVGEHRPELLMLRGGGGYVKPSASGGGSGRALTVNVNVAPGVGSASAEIGREIVRHIHAYEYGSGAGWRKSS